jgi:hypothetical protein
MKAKTMKGNQIMKNRNTISIFTAILFGLACFALMPGVQAVSPAPDGGYPGGNTAEGQAALLNLTTGGYNTAVGLFSLRSDTIGNLNTAIGAGTLLANTRAGGGGAGDENTATGAGALLSNTGGANTANGDSALLLNTTGSTNTAIGLDAIYSNTTGNDNTAIGFGALFHNTTGSGSIVLGVNAGGNVTTANNVICIGADGNNLDNSCFIGNIFNATSSGGIAVFINSNGRLGTATSSRRFKEEIKPMDKASEALFALKPVAFRDKKDIDPAGTPQLGLVAEEVEKVNPDLVVRDKEGKPYSVRYDQVNAMLLNEFLKAHRKMDEQEATIAELKLNDAQQQREIAALATTVKEQAGQIQRVSAQLQLCKPVAQTVVSDQ